MLSPELARKLRDAGVGCRGCSPFHYNDPITGLPLSWECNPMPVCFPLDGLLGEVEERETRYGYGYVLERPHTSGNHKYRFHYYGIMRVDEDEDGNQTTSRFRSALFYAPTPEDAVALALLEIVGSHD